MTSTYDWSHRGYQEAVSWIVVETREGSLGILSHRLDSIAAQMPGMLLYIGAFAVGVLVGIAFFGGLMWPSATPLPSPQKIPVPKSVR